MFLIILLIFPININSQSLFMIEIPRYSIIYTISPNNSTDYLPAQSEIYFDHQEKNYHTNLYQAMSNYSIIHKTNKTTIKSSILNKIIYTNTNDKYISEKKTKNIWERSGRNYRYQTLKRTHLSNNFFHIITNNKQVITNTSIIFTSNKNKTVQSGLWYDYFTDSYITNPKLLQIDHIVPFAEAFRSHTNHWTKKDIKHFFDTNIESGLLAVRSQQNNKKSDNPPNKYLPPNTKFTNIYINMYINTKKHYNLIINNHETNIL